MSALRTAILTLVAAAPISPRALTDRLMRDGWKAGDVRNELSCMWDEGEVKLDAERKVRMP